MSSFGERFKQLRIEKKLTQEELVTLFNERYNLTFGKSAISQYENNKRMPEMPAMEKFADFFEVSLDYIMGRSDLRSTKDIIYSNAFHSISSEGLTDEDIEIVKSMIENLKNKNKK